MAYAPPFRKAARFPPKWSRDMKYRAPEGVTALSCAGETIAPDEAGVFEASEELDRRIEGSWLRRIVESDLLGATASEKSARAGVARREGELTMAQGDLISLAQLKAHLGVQSSGDDMLLAGLISQISRAICAYLNRPFVWPRDVVDHFDGNGSERRSSCETGR